MNQIHRILNNFCRGLLGVSLLLFCIALGAVERPVRGVDRAYIDKSVSPCKDFYNYANGAFNKTPIPGEYSNWGVNQEIDERNYAILKQILESAAKTGGPSGSIAQRVGDFYATGMDEKAIEDNSLKPLATLLAAIDSIKRLNQIAPVLGRLAAQGINIGFRFDVQIDDKDSTKMTAAFRQGGLGLPERDYYFRNTPNAEDIRKAYVAHIARIFELAGASAASAKADADTVMAFETKLATASRTLTDLCDPEKNYNKFKRTALAKLTPGFAWERYFSQINFPKAENTVLVGQPEFFTAFQEQLKSEPVSSWRIYIRWHVLHRTAEFLSRDFVDEDFAFYGKKLSGKTELGPRWKRVLAVADDSIGQDLGRLYVERAFSEKAKIRALEMVKFHLDAMRNIIITADWMSEPTKQQAYKKIDTLRAKVGYPDNWRDYSKLIITRDFYLRNVLAASAFETKRQLAKLGKPVDRDDWQMNVQTNNAYYEPTLNEMCFPAGILQPPFFDEKADDASNYGALASTIGHELTHAFDDQGRQYDWQGNLKNWWTEEDVKKFNERAGFVVQQYDAFEPLPGLRINGRQTVSENIADIGGLRVSYEAFKLAIADKKLKNIDGLTPDQRFFIAFAQGWRTNQRPEQLRLSVTSDVHSPARFRVIGPVANFSEFRAAFGCRKTGPTWQRIW